MFLKENAEDFFNAFEVLHESNDALINGLGSTLGNTFASRKFGRLPTMGVAIVCLAFSLELYIKYLHYVTTQKAPRGHNILEFFRKLSERTQQKIFSHPSISNYGWNFLEFEKEIEAISDGFEKRRYLLITLLHFASKKAHHKEK